MEVDRRLFLAAGVLLILTIAVRPCGVPPERAAIAGQRQDETVAYDPASGRYHCRKCAVAVACGSRCELIPLSEAVRKGGVPCDLCGGTCRSAQRPGRSVARP